MKILHMTPPEVRNGVYQYVFNHMSFMNLSRYEFSFLTSVADELRKTKEFEKYRFPVYRLNGVQRDGRERFEKEVREILSQGFDAIHLHTSAWRGFLIEEIAMELKIPKVIVHSHSSGIDFVDEVRRKEILKDHIYYRERFTMEYATDVCACSGPAAEWLFSEQIPKEKIRILPNAVDVKRFRYDKKIREQTRKRLGLESRVVIGHVGRYSFTKNQEFLVHCFKKAHERNHRLYLLLIGQGENRTMVQKLVKELGMEEDISCYGWMENVSDYLQAMDVFCLPSRFEGLPISAVEAQAAGLKCLISDTVTKETDLTGLVKFLPLKQEQWSDALAEAEIDKYRSWMDDCFDRAGYSIESSCKKLMQLYESA